MPKQHNQILPGRDVAGIIGMVARESGAQNRHATRIQRGERLLELEQIGTLVFAVAKLEQRLRGLTIRSPRRSSVTSSRRIDHHENRCNRTSATMVNAIFTSER